MRRSFARCRRRRPLNAVAATVAVAGATLAATACCWCGFICAAFVLYLAAVVATFGWASFQGFAFDVLALVFAAAAPLGEASVEGLLGVLAALFTNTVAFGAWYTASAEGGMPWAQPMDAPRSRPGSATGMGDVRDDELL